MFARAQILTFCHLLLKIVKMISMPSEILELSDTSLHILDSLITKAQVSAQNHLALESFVFSSVQLKDFISISPTAFDFVSCLFIHVFT